MLFLYPFQTEPEEWVERNFWLACEISATDEEGVVTWERQKTNTFFINIGYECTGDDFIFNTATLGGLENGNIYITMPQEIC